MSDPVLASILRRLSRLEAQQAGGEATTPNYLTIDPTTGAVSAAFSGSLTLPESPNTLIFSNPNSIAWLDRTTGQVREFIAGGLNAGNHLLLLESGQGAHGENATITLNHTDTGQAGVNAQANDGFGHSAFVGIIGPGGNSDFMRNSATSSSLPYFAGSPAILGMAGNAPYGPGKGEVFLNGGGTAAIEDPDFRFDSNGRYVAHQTGVFLCSCVVTASAAASVAMSLTAMNFDTGYEVGCERIIVSNFGETISCAVIVPATAGQHLTMRLGVSAQVTLLRLDTNYGNYVTTFSVVQVS